MKPKPTQQSDELILLQDGEILLKAKDSNNYGVTNFGRVYSLPSAYARIGWLTPRIRKGYSEVHLRENGLSKLRRVHRLVAETFIPNPDNKPQVNHIDGNRQHNHVTNLEWCTAAENVQHAIRTGLMKTKRSVGHRLNENQVINIHHCKGAISSYKLAALYGVSRRTIAYIWNGQSWSKLFS